METKVLLIVDDSGVVEPSDVVFGTGYGELDSPRLGNPVEIKGWGELDGRARELLSPAGNVIGYRPCFI